MPDVTTVHHDVALTNVSVAYKNATFIASQIAPEVPVRRQSNRYFIYDPGREGARSTRDDRAPGAEANEVGFDLSSDYYHCDDHALESVIPDEERDNADSPLAPEVDRAEFLTEKILLNQEIALAGILTAADALPGETLTGVNDWDNDAVDPVADVEAARGAITASVGAQPNTLVLPFPVYQRVRNHPLITDRVKYSRLGVAGTEELAQLFDVERVLVPRAVVNVANPGQDASLSNVWGSHALLLTVPGRAGLKVVSTALTFVWALADGMRGTSVQSWREERRKATLVRVQKYYDAKITASAAGYIIRNAVGNS